MFEIENIVIRFLLGIFSREEINAFLRSPQNTATIIGCLIAIAGALLGTFLLLRGMSLTTDAISHTILLGIVVAFLVMVNLFGMEPDLASPWLLIGAAADELERDVECLGSVVPADDAPATVEVGRDADVIDSDTLDGVVDMVDEVADGRWRSVCLSCRPSRAGRSGDTRRARTAACRPASGWDRWWSSGRPARTGWPG